MDVQSAANLNIPEGSVRNIHDKDKRLLWSAVGYNVRYDGDTTQQTYTGKNKMPVQSVDLTDNRIKEFVIALPAGTYTYSFDLDSFEVGTNSNFSIYSQLYLSTGTWKDNNISGLIDNVTSLGRKSYTFTLDVDAIIDLNHLSNIRIPLTQYNNGARASISNIMIEPGSTATTYEQYVGGIPAPNPDYPQDVNVAQGKQTILVSGKNLFLIPETETKNGVTLTKNSDGTFNLSGTATATATFNIKLDAMIESGTYTLSKSEGNFIAVVQDYLNTSWLSQLITLNYNVNSVTTSINPVGNRVSFVIQARNGITYNLQNVKIQLEKNSSATQFEVHQNKIVNFDLRGKNLFDKSTIALGNNWNGAIGSTCYPFNSGQLARAVVLEPVEPNTWYTIRLYESNWYLMQVIEADSAYTILNSRGQFGSEVTLNFKTTATTSYIGFKFKYGSAGTTDFIPSMLDELKLQVEEGDTATTYQPYHAPIELCKIGNYQDYIYKGADGWYVHKEIGKYTFIGDENWRSSPYGTNSWTVDGLLTGYLHDADAINTACDFSKGVAFNNRGSGDSTNTCVCYYSNVGQLNIRNTTLTTQAQMQTAATDKNIYYLITPIDTKITDNTLISQLNAIHDWLKRYDYYGVVSGNLPIIINRSGII